MKKISSVISIALAAGLLHAQNGTPLQGDMNHDGSINSDDVTCMAEILLQRRSLEQWQAKNGSVTYSTLVSGTQNLCGDLDASGTLTVKDLVSLVALTKNPSEAKVVSVNSQGQIVFTNGSGFLFNPEDGGLIDDGEIIF